MKTEFNTDQYTMTHGKKPAGRGYWAFKFYAIDYKRVSVEPFFSPEMTLSEAKAWVKPIISDLALRMDNSAQRVSIMVMP
jgi:hypothetical protein